jgi:ribonucleoside-diphosphate reductase alpha chain
MDCKLLNTYEKELTDKWLVELKTAAVNANAYHSALLGIPASKAITCVKPSGTVSSLVDSSPGIHTRYAPYYIRRVRADINDPLCKLMIDQGVPYEKDITKPEHTLVFSFPIKAPQGSVFRNDWTALEHLEHYKLFLKNWCHHNPSITVTVKENEWMQVGSWLYDNFEETVACSFLPHSDMVYQQAPYEEIDEETYKKMMEKMPKTIDWERLKEYEKYDQTTGSQELACVSGACNL